MLPSATEEEFSLTAAGEPICVRVRMRNPVGLGLRLTSVRLECSFEPLVGGWVVLADSTA